MSDNSLRPAIGRVTGLGSAKDGTGHWWVQRLTAIALVPLAIWWVVSLCALVGAPQEQIVAWLQNPLAGLLMVSFLAVGFYHLKLGMQVVIEDYVHTEWMKITCLIGNIFGCFLLGGASILAVLAMMFGG